MSRLDFSIQFSVQCYHMCPDHLLLWDHPSRRPWLAVSQRYNIHTGRLHKVTREGSYAAFLKHSQKGAHRYCKLWQLDVNFGQSSSDFLRKVVTGCFRTLEIFIKLFFYLFFFLQVPYYQPYTKTNNINIHS